MNNIVEEEGTKEDFETKQKFTKKEESKENFFSKTFDLGNRDYYNASGRRWCHLADRVVTLVQEASVQCYFTFQTRISCTGSRSQKQHTNNNPGQSNNPSLTVNFYNEEKGLLFFQKIETERYGNTTPYPYHGLTVRCEYDEHPIEVEYSVGNRPFDEVYYCNTSYGRSSTGLYRCP